jgi:hypothetical protein
MPVSIARKLQAFKAAHFPDREFQVRRVLLSAPIGSGNCSCRARHERNRSARRLRPGRASRTSGARSGVARRDDAAAQKWAWKSNTGKIIADPLWVPLD